MLNQSPSPEVHYPTPLLWMLVWPNLGKPYIQE